METEEEKAERRRREKERQLRLEQRQREIHAGNIRMCGEIVDEFVFEAACLKASDPARTLLLPFPAFPIQTMQPPSASAAPPEQLLRGWMACIPSNDMLPLSGLHARHGKTLQGRSAEVGREGNASPVLKSPLLQCQSERDRRCAVPPLDTESGPRTAGGGANREGNPVCVPLPVCDRLCSARMLCVRYLALLDCPPPPLPLRAHTLAGEKAPGSTARGRM